MANRKGRYNSIHELREVGISEASLEKLADADAFRSMGQDRRNALWQTTTRDYQPHALFSDDQHGEENIVLPEMPLAEHVVHDYASTSLSLKAHPVSFVRNTLNQLRVTTSEGLAAAKDGDFVKVAGLILVRQRPGTASGVCFITLEDETGTINLVIWKDKFDEYRKEIIQARLLLVEGRLQKEGEVTHVIANKCVNASRLLQQLVHPRSAEPSLDTRVRSDETTSKPDARTKGKTTEFQGEIFPEGRNFR
jgi:error-prone DNA polymerase